MPEQPLDVTANGFPQGTTKKGIGRLQARYRILRQAVVAVCSHLTTLRFQNISTPTPPSSPSPPVLSPLGPAGLLSVFMDLPVLDVSLHEIIQYVASFA